MQIAKKLGDINSTKDEVLERYLGPKRLGYSPLL